MEKEHWEVTVDPIDENLRHSHKYYICILKEDGGYCEYPNRYCKVKEQNDDPTIQPGKGITFNDGAILKDAVKELDGLFEEE
jgi:hypothetical protein